MLNSIILAILFHVFTDFYGIGWKRRSGKKKLNTAQVEKAIDTAKTARTGARERYLRK